MSLICLSRFDKFSMTRSLALKLAWKIVHMHCSLFILKFVFEVKNEYIYIYICTLAKENLLVSGIIFLTTECR